MTLAQSHALAPLLSELGEALKIYQRFDTVDQDHCSPGIYLTARQWQRILEEFGTP